MSAPCRPKVAADLEAGSSLWGQASRVHRATCALPDDSALIESFAKVFLPQQICMIWTSKGFDDPGNFFPGPLDHDTFTIVESEWDLSEPDQTIHAFVTDTRAEIWRLIHYSPMFDVAEIISPHLNLSDDSCSREAARKIANLLKPGFESDLYINADKVRIMHVSYI